MAHLNLFVLGMESDAADIVHELLELLTQTPDRAPVFHPENVVPLISLCQAEGLVESLAGQLDAAELKAAFLNSSLVQELHRARAALSITP